MVIEAYTPGPGEMCGKKGDGCLKTPVARLLSGGWVIFLCEKCLDLELRSLSLGSPVNAGSETELRGDGLKMLPVLGVIPELL